MSAILETDAQAAGPAWGTLYALSLARVLITGFVLLSALLFGPPLDGHGARVAATDIVPGLVAYCGLSVAMALGALYLRRHFVGQLTTQLAVDLVLATLLVVLGGGMRSEFVVLYLVPIAGGSLMLPTSAAFFTTSIAVLMLLGDAVLRTLRLDPGEPQLFQAGLYGAALFGLTALLRLLSIRLKRQERLAHMRGLDLQSQLDINRLVISEMEQGVLVVDATTRVRANNHAARVLLGLARNAQLTGRRLADEPGMRPLAQEFQRWLQADVHDAGWSRAVLLTAAAAEPGDARGARPVRARFASPRSRRSGEYVVFLEDVNAVEQRAQQLKLAAMGRLTASIAHEIRNPLAAISNAGQLLAEEEGDGTHRRLVEIVRENTARLNRLVEDVLRVARREPPLADTFVLRTFVEQWVAEFLRDRGLAPELIRVSGAGDDAVRFEQNHLRQILFNLVDNALRYGSGGPGSVEIHLEPAADTGGHARMWILDDGKGVAAGDRAAIFEPFYTTHNRGTGLGLFLAREFCVANRAELSYERVPQPGMAPRDGFVVRFSRLTGDPALDAGFDTLPVAPGSLQRDLS